jgi:hypothetical protein
LGQRFVNGAPQSPQNFLPAGLLLPHFEQRINSPLAQRFAPHLSPCRIRDYSYLRVKAYRTHRSPRDRNVMFVNENVVISRSRPYLPKERALSPRLTFTCSGS